MAQAGLNDEKNGGWKSRWTVPLRSRLTSTIMHVPTTYLLLKMYYSVALLYISQHFDKNSFYVFCYHFVKFFLCFWKTFLAIHCTVIFYSIQQSNFAAGKSLVSAFRGKKQNSFIFYRTKLTTFFDQKARIEPKFCWHFLCTVKKSYILLLAQKRFKKSKKSQQIWFQHVHSCYLQ